MILYPFFQLSLFLIESLRPPFLRFVLVADLKFEILVYFLSYHVSHQFVFPFHLLLAVEKAFLFLTRFDVVFYIFDLKVLGVDVCVVAV